MKNKNRYNKFIILILLILSPFLIMKAQQINPNGYNKFTYPNGAISSEGYMKDGKPIGYWKSYYVDGILKTEGNRKNEKLDSVWRFYDPKGNLTEIIDYKNDIRSGYHKKYKLINDSDYVTNVMISKELYVNGEKNGKSYYYDDRSRLKTTVEYEKNYKNGFEKHYDTEGNVILIITYSFNNITNSERLNRKDNFNRKQGIWKTFYPNDKLESYANYVNDTLNGYYRKYNSYNELIVSQFYIMGNLKDLTKEEKIEDKKQVKKEYYPSGNVKTSGSFIEDKPVGIHRVYDEKGVITETKSFSDSSILVSIGIVDKDGQKEGDWKYLYENGSIKSFGNYKDGKKEGNWNFYYISGVLEQKGAFLNGKPSGNWIWYFENGNIRRKGSYEKGREMDLFYELSEEGDTLSKGNYIYGLKTGKWVYSINDDIQEGNYASGKREGIWKHYYNDGKLKFEGNFIDGYPDGKHKTYYPNGITKQVAFFSMGNKDNKWKDYDKEGNLVTITEYKGDKKYKIDGQKVKDK